MDMPSIFYAARPMNTDRSRWRHHHGPTEEIIGASAYMDISITRSYARRAAARTREEARRPRRGPARRDTSHYDSSGVYGHGFRARIRRGGERYLSGNNLRDKSPICIDASCPVMRDDAA